MNSNIINLYDEEVELVVRVNDPFIDRFSDENLDTYMDLRSPGYYPRIYGLKSPTFFEYSETRLINVDDIILDANNTQVPRTGVNPAEPDIEARMHREGFELFKQTIFVTKHPNIVGKYIIIEGRTRAKLLIEEFGMENIIAEVFVGKNGGSMSFNDILRFGVYMNSSKDVSGKTTYLDLLNAITLLIASDKEAFPDDLERPDFMEIVAAELDFLSDHKITNGELNRLLIAAEEQWQGTPLVRSFKKDSKEAQTLMEKTIGHQKLREDAAKGIYYKLSSNIVVNFPKMIVNGMAQSVQLAEEYDGIPLKELRLVIYCGTLKAYDPGQDWIDNVLGYQKAVKSWCKLVSRHLFNNVDLTDVNVKDENFTPQNQCVTIYGCIPQVIKLQDKYPMDKIVLYK